MIKKNITGILLSLASASQVYAQVPKVVVDIAPLHSLVTQVMDGVGEPALLIRPESSPHEYSLRPSEAKALSEADIVFWISEDLTPWLEKPLSSLASSATNIEMVRLNGTTLHKFREGATFEAHEHHEKHSEHEIKDKHEHHDEHVTNKNEEKHQSHAKHEDDHDKHDEYNHEEVDPHVWLDPKNAEVWVKAIANALSSADSDNTQAYQDNAKLAINRLQKLSSEIEQQAKTLQGIKFIVFHDAYQYFELRFKLVASGAISISDASDPSPARISQIQQTVKELGVTCIFTEPQFNPQLVNTVFKNSVVTNIETMDPLGTNIPIGKNQYSALLKSMINSIQQCKR